MLTQHLHAHTHTHSHTHRLQEDPPAGVSGAPTDNNIMLWNAVIFGYVPDLTYDYGYSTITMTMSLMAYSAYCDTLLCVCVQFAMYMFKLCLPLSTTHYGVCVCVCVYLLTLCVHAFTHCHSLTLPLPLPSLRLFLSHTLSLTLHYRPKDTPFEDGTFKLTMQFSEEYPNKPPVVRFVSKMFHPNGKVELFNVSFQFHVCLLCPVYADGSICLDILQNRWSPTYDVSSILTSIQVS